MKRARIERSTQRVVRREFLDFLNITFSQLGAENMIDSPFRSKVAVLFFSRSAGVHRDTKLLVLSR
jgi:hypothetical protein